jgi:hypothetical protein
VHLEQHLNANGTRIIKFFLHISKDEQRKRLLARIDEPDKNWKFSAADVEERKYCKQHAKAYEQCLSVTSCEDAPWYIVPAGDKKTARLIVSTSAIAALAGLNMAYPKANAERQRELLALRAQLIDRHCRVVRSDTRLRSGHLGPPTPLGRCREPAPQDAVTSLDESLEPMTIRPYPAQWQTATDIPGLGSVLLRPIRPEDE